MENYDIVWPSYGEQLGRHSISLVIFCLIFGFLLGLAGFLSVAYLGGFVESERPEIESTEPQYANATERLEKYQCGPAETKMIVMGGVEDGYDPAGEETTILSDSAKAYLEIAGSVPTRSYDDPAQNRYFSDAFEIPARTFHGIIAIGMEERSRLHNDGLNMGYFNGRSRYLDEDNHGNSISKIMETWRQDKGYVWADLDALKLTKFTKKDKGSSEVSGYSHLSLLDGIRRNNDRVFEVHLSDDTIVDFIGFALCLEPEESKGNVFAKIHHGGSDITINFGDEFVNLYSFRGDYAGNLSCRESRPIPCIDDQNLKAPEAFTEFTNGLWSGGYIKFTEAVAGNRFKTEDEVDAFCAAKFGDAYRSVNMKDGMWQGSIVGYGEYPEGYDEFWVSIKDSSHQNCWSKRMDYDDLAHAKAKK